MTEVKRVCVPGTAVVIPSRWQGGKGLLYLTSDLQKKKREGERDRNMITIKKDNTDEAGKIILKGEKRETEEKEKGQFS